LRGASGSFGVVTSIQVKTFAAPDSATVFQYSWDLSAAEAANATLHFQNFVQGNISQEFGVEIVLKRGSSSGQVSFGLTGGCISKPWAYLLQTVADYSRLLQTTVVPVVL
jgi:hypothetical protein